MCATNSATGVLAALALAAAMLVRSVPALLTIRSSLRQHKDQPAGAALAVGTSAAGLPLAVWIARLRLASWRFPGFALLLAVRSLRLLWRQPPISARQLGLLELVLGAGMRLSLTLAWRDG